MQGGTEARYHNYLSIYKNLKFSALPWYDLQVFSDEENHTTRQAIKLRTDANSDSASDTEMPTDLTIDDAIQVKYPKVFYQGLKRARHIGTSLASRGSD